MSIYVIIHDMKSSLKEDKFITHVFINNQRIIPSDSFIIGENEYLLLEILNSSDDIVYMKIIGIRGLNMGNIYFIPKKEFEEKTLLEIKESLVDYKH